MLGGSGRDTLSGKFGTDRLAGGAGRDLLFGSHSDGISSDRRPNFLRGGAGADQLRGDRGDDVLNGGAGRDFVDGFRQVRGDRCAACGQSEWSTAKTDAPPVVT
jgi:serralysin